MGRPTEFDRDEVLDAAIRVFARHGFSAASTSDLLEEMRLNRQSLYGAFGDKRSLFLEALDRYSDSSLSRMRDVMSTELSAISALEAALLLDLGRGADIESGCLGVGSVVEFGRSDQEISGLGDRAVQAFVALFSERVQQGMAVGELASDLDTEAVGRMLLTLKSGLKVAARGGASEDDNRKSVRLVLRGLMGVDAMRPV